MNTFNIFLSILAMISLYISANDLDDIVFKVSSAGIVIYCDSRICAAYDSTDNSYQAMDIRDSGMPRLENAKMFFDNLKERFYNQGPLIFEQSQKE